MDNQTWVKPHTEVCYEDNRVNSQGIFLGDKPLLFSLPVFLIEVSIIFLSSTGVHYLLKPLHQSRFLSQLIAGILLGPTLLSRIPGVKDALFPDRATLILDIVSFASYFFFIFVTSLKADFSLLRKPHKIVLVLSLTSFFLPCILTLACVAFLRPSLPANLQEGPLLLNLAITFSRTFYPVLADVLDEMSLLNTELGRIAMSSSLIIEALNQLIMSGMFAYMTLVKVNSPLMAIGLLVSFIVFVLGTVFVLRPAILQRIKEQTEAGEMLREEWFVGMVLMTFLMALATEVIGLHPVIGPFLFGLVLPEGMPIGVTMSERLEPLMIGLLLPAYMALSGYRADLTTMVGMKGWGVLEGLLVICYVVKLVGSAGVAMYFNMSWWEAASLALMMNLKGIGEVSLVSMWSDTRMVNASQFSFFIVNIIVSTSLTTPLISYLYNPSTHYRTRKLRTIHHLKPYSPLPILVVVHSEDHVPALLDLLEAFPPLNLTLLHLTHLSGHLTATLRPYIRSHLSRCTTPSDRIVNAFRYFEARAPPSTVALLPFVASARPQTMHNDVCALAFKDNSHLIILPFHKHSSGAYLTNSTILQSINRNVLSYAPCSVAILVDQGIHVGVTCARTNMILQHIVVYFFGSADDREALALATRMADNPAISLTIVRFLNYTGVDDEEDEKVLEECRKRYEGNGNVVYVEKEVEDGEETVVEIQRMSHEFELLVVGRRIGMESALTRGLSEWSEYPELGVVGDLLVSMEFNRKVSVLVVQQQLRYGREGNRRVDNGGRSNDHDDHGN